MTHRWGSGAAYPPAGGIRALFQGMSATAGGLGGEPEGQLRQQRHEHMDIEHMDIAIAAAH